MVFQNRFRTSWWLVLLGLSSFYLISRTNDLIAGNTNIFDIFVFVPWFALMLVPIFQEMNFLGFNFKQELKGEIKTVKTEVKEQILNLRTDIQNSIIFKQNYNPIINVGSQSSDAELKLKEEKVKEIIESAFLERGLSSPIDSNLDFSSSDDVIYLFRVRYEIETELRRIALLVNLDPGSRLYGMRLLNILTKQVIPIEVSELISEVWRICTPAIHGEPISPTQLDFVKKSYPEFMPFIKSMEIMR